MCATISPSIPTVHVILMGAFPVNVVGAGAEFSIQVHRPEPRVYYSVGFGYYGHSYHHHHHHRRHR